MKFKKIEYIDICLIIGILGIFWFLVCYLPSRSLNEIDVMRFYEAQFYEEDGIGKGYLLICSENVCREMLLHGKNITREEAENFIENHLEVSLSKYEGLKNGDTVIMRLKADKKILRSYGLKFINNQRRVKVTGVEEH